MFDKVIANTSFIGETGYANHSRNFFTALNKLVPVKIRNFTVGKSWAGLIPDLHGGEFYITDEHKEMLYKQTCIEKNGLFDFDIYGKNGNDIESGNNINIVLNEVNHYYFFSPYKGKKIAYNVWESTLYPDGFFKKLLEFDQLWVPTQWNKRCAVQQGYPEHRVKVVQEAVDETVFFPEILKGENVLDDYKDNRFKFLLFGRWDYRKSTREIIDAFLKTFSKKDPVDLIISVDNMFAADGLKDTPTRLLANGFNDSRIKVKSFVSRADYIKYMKMGHVFVSCSRGEGWNLPLIEAMACGTPSIYSNWGSQLEFAYNKGIPVKIVGERPASDGKETAYKMIGEDVPGNYCEPDFDHLSFVMRDAYTNYKTYKAKAVDESYEIRKEFTWKKMADKAYFILSEFSNRQDNNNHVLPNREDKIQSSEIENIIDIRWEMVDSANNTKCPKISFFPKVKYRNKKIDVRIKNWLYSDIFYEDTFLFNNFETDDVYYWIILNIDINSTRAVSIDLLDGNNLLLSKEIFFDSDLVKTDCFDGIKVDYVNADMEPHFYEAIKREVYQSHLYERFFKVEDGDVVVDVGSHVGMFLMSLKDRRIGKYFGIEPRYAYFRCLSKNVNNVFNNDNYCLLNKAMWKESSDKYYPDYRMAIHNPSDKRTSSNKTQISTISFKDFIKKYNISHIDFLKTDCEGGEYFIFNEENYDFIRDHVRKISGELHMNKNDISPEYSPMDVINSLKSFGFSVILTGIDGIDITDTFEKNISYFTEIILYAEKKENVSRPIVSDIIKKKDGSKRVCFVVGADSKYMDFLNICVDSIRSYTNIPIIAYGFGCDIPFNSLNLIKKTIPISDIPSIKEHVKCDVYFTRITSCINALDEENFDYYICLDADVIAYKNIEKIIDYIDLVDNYPVGMRYKDETIIQWKTVDGERYVREYGDKICQVYNIRPRSNGFMSATGVFIFNKKCKWFFEEMVSVGREVFGKEILDIVDRNGENHFVDDHCFSEERILNMLMWKYGFNKFLPVTMVSKNGATVVNDKIHYFFDDSEYKDSKISFLKDRDYDFIFLVDPMKGQIYNQFPDKSQIILFHSKPNQKDIDLSRDILRSYKEELMQKDEDFLSDDFIYVTGCNINYMPLVEVLVRSVLTFSKHKIIVYGLNCDVPFDYPNLIKRRIDKYVYPEGAVISPRDIRLDIMMSKMHFILESINQEDYSTYVWIDADSIVSKNIDDIERYKDKIENYPLINSHLFDHIRYLYEDGKLGDHMSVGLVEFFDVFRGPTCYPWCHANLMTYNKKCKWFFEEVLSMEKRLIDSQKRYLIDIAADEPLINVLLWKHNFTGKMNIHDYDTTLHNAIDLYKTDNWMEGFFYAGHTFSVHAKFPSSREDIFVFHACKEPERASSILDQYIRYLNNGENTENISEVSSDLNISFCNNDTKEGYKYDGSYESGILSKTNSVLNYKDLSVGRIISGDVLSYFSQNEVPIVLKEWTRILKDGGDLFIKVPDLEWCVLNWLNNPEIHKWGKPIDSIYKSYSNKCYYKTGFTSAKIKDILSNVGYSEISVKQEKIDGIMYLEIEAKKRG